MKKLLGIVLVFMSIGAAATLYGDVFNDGIPPGTAQPQSQVWVQGIGATANYYLMYAYKKYVKLVPQERLDSLTIARTNYNAATYAPLINPAFPFNAYVGSTTGKNIIQMRGGNTGNSDGTAIVMLRSDGTTLFSIGNVSAAVTGGYPYYDQRPTIQTDLPFLLNPITNMPVVIAGNYITGDISKLQVNGEINLLPATSDNHAPTLGQVRTLIAASAGGSGGGSMPYTGTANQFVKADGTYDNTAYAPLSAANTWSQAQYFASGFAVQNGAAFSMSKGVATINVRTDNLNSNQNVYWANASGTIPIVTLVPATYTSPGADGMIAYDSNYFYWYSGGAWHRTTADGTFNPNN